MHNPKIHETQPVSVVISMRNRTESVVTTIKSILANDYPDFELKVVYQRDTDLTEASIQPFLSVARFYYLRSTSKGLCKGRNFGITNTRNELILFTGDDCEVPQDWISNMVQAFFWNNFNNFFLAWVFSRLSYSCRWCNE